MKKQKIEVRPPQFKDAMNRAVAQAVFGKTDVSFQTNNVQLQQSFVPAWSNFETADPVSDLLSVYGPGFFAGTGATDSRIKAE